MVHTKPKTILQENVDTLLPPHMLVSVLHTRIGELVYGRHLPHNAALHQGFEAFRVFSQDLKRRFRKTCSNVIFLLPCASLAGWSMRSFHRQPSTADVRYFPKAKMVQKRSKGNLLPPFCNFSLAEISLKMYLISFRKRQLDRIVTSTERRMTRSLVRSQVDKKLPSALLK